MLQGLVLVCALHWPPLSTWCTWCCGQGQRDLLMLSLGKKAVCGNVQAGTASGIRTL